MSFIKAHYAAIIAILTPIIGFLAPSLHAAATANPKSTVGVICTCVLMAWANRSFLSKS